MYFNMILAKQLEARQKNVTNSKTDMFDATGNYNWAFSIGSIAGVINLLILALLFTRIRRQNRPQGAFPEAAVP